MKKLIIIAIIFVAFILSTNKAFAQIQTDSAKLETSHARNSLGDKRAEALRRVFQKYNSPLVDSAEDYVALADKNGVDWKLLPAISGLESSFGKKLRTNSYNAYGWGGGRIYFTSWEHGIDTITKALNEKYYNRGANTVWSIGPIYAESPTWAVRVNTFMSKIEAEYLSLLRDDVEITI